MTVKYLRWIAWALCLLTGIALSLKQLREPDIWWMLKTGEWMLEHGQVVSEDIFSYTQAGVPWINVKWGFEIILELFNRIGGPAFTMCLQAIVTILLVWITYRRYGQMRLIGHQSRPQRPTIGIISVTLLMLFCISFRMIGRPEMISHLFMVIFSSLLLSYRRSPSLAIYGLVPLQILWANGHEAFGTGMVMILVAIVSHWIEYFVNRKQSALPKHLTIASALALGAVALNPNGTALWLHPLNIFTQVGENKFTTELNNFLTPGYWEAEAWINMGVALICGIQFFSRRPQNGSDSRWYRRPFRQFGLDYLLLWGAFLLLSLTAYRNIPFFILFASPQLAITIDRCLQWFNRKASQKLQTGQVKIVFSAGLLAVVLTAYGLVATGSYYELTKARDQYGLKLNPDFHPAGAADFLEKNQITGTGFADYLTSSYLLWKLYPDFKTYIDLRDLDIFPTAFFRDYLKMMNDPAYFDQQAHQFDYVVLYRPEFPGLHRHLHQHPDWALVFADPVAAIYLKDKPAYRPVIRQYRHQRDRDIFQPSKILEPSALSSTFSAMISPFYDSRQKPATDHDLIAASFYLSVGEYEQAIKRAEQSISHNGSDWQNREMLGNIYLNLLDLQTGPEQRNAVMQSAYQAYRQAIKIHKGAADSYLGLGLIARYNGQTGSAMNWFKKCVEADGRQVKCWISMAECQNQFAAKNPGKGQEYLKLWLKYMEQAFVVNPENPLVQLNLGVGYCRIGNCRRAVELIKPVVQTPGLPVNEVNAAKACLKQCGR